MNENTRDHNDLDLIVASLRRVLLICDGTMTAHANKYCLAFAIYWRPLKQWRRRRRTINNADRKEGVAYTQWLGVLGQN